MAKKRVWFYIIVFSSVFLMGYEPPEQQRDSERTSASSTRGCVVKQGELSLIGTNPLTTQLSQPILLFEIKPASPEETFLVVVRDKDLNVVFERKIVVSQEQYIPIKLSSQLVKSENYNVVAGLLCDNKIRHAKILSVDLSKVDYETASDQLIQLYLEGKPEIEFDAKEDQEQN
ncbi:hypothetical protein [Crocosphaera chwakensis]|uniref:Uncharacterized protein n=1 Tax=Crocosphaera chwakensis CCY0110 TaxID=391612 RepID=A3IYJ2_9CHRO|nr:hypothetical protein [Crocosphaera chwakensis]EAZ88441.1 hypothetical protein CY0110_31140 [Crocosphaera chwakensis CCY0110]